VKRRSTKTTAAPSAAADANGRTPLRAPILRPALSFGVELHSGGAEFRVFSRHAEQVFLLLFSDGPREHAPTTELPMERHGDVWRTFVEGVAAGQRYAYRAAGVHDLEHGHLYDAERVLFDPYAKAYTTVGTANARVSRFTGPVQARSVVIDDHAPPPTPGPKRSIKDWIIYEAHVRGMTAHPSSECGFPGTYLGLIDKLDYLRDLGVTTIELLPIHEFDPLENQRKDPTTGKKLKNYWGYSTAGFFAPHGPYAATQTSDGAVADFHRLVSEIHQRGMEVVLDVVYNHTAEGDQAGPVLHFKGFDNPVYYHLADDRSHYRDFSGCGNSLRANNAVVRRMIIDSLRYWALRFGVDGFRFDLASVLCRDDDGGLSLHAPLIEEITEDPYLRDVKMIAEPWDAAGGYLLGGFPAGRWSEWNGRYRDDLRSFWRGDHGKTGALATRLMGSSDLFHQSGPAASVNFVTSHDGFTLADLCSYTAKRNLANGEGNLDGENNNHSTNFGVEGETADPRIDGERLRYARNMFATLLLSQGVPMLTAGDEFRRTQHGNNNAYCQDNEISWIDWRLLEKNRELYEFVRRLIWFRRKHPVFRRSRFFGGHPRPGGLLPEATWFDPDARVKNWQHDDGALMCQLDGLPPIGSTDEPDDEMLLLFNNGAAPRGFQLAGNEDPSRRWRLVFDTGSATYAGVYSEGLAPTFHPGGAYGLVPRSMALFRRSHR
jgi:isoamylase